MCGKALPTRTIDNMMAVSTSITHVAATGWIPALSVKEVQSLIAVTSSSGAQFRAWAVYRIATTDMDAPGAWTDLEASPLLVAAGSKDTTDVRDISSSLTSAFYIQFGVACKLNSGSTAERGEVIITFTVRA